jgi:hypothetical protein
LTKIIIFHERMISSPSALISLWPLWCLFRGCLCLACLDEYHLWPTAPQAVVLNVMKVDYHLSIFLLGNELVCYTTRGEVVKGCGCLMALTGGCFLPLFMRYLPNSFPLQSKYLCYTSHHTLNSLRGKTWDHNKESQTVAAHQPTATWAHQFKSANNQITHVHPQPVLNHLYAAECLILSHYFTVHMVFYEFLWPSIF